MSLKNAYRQLLHKLLHINDTPESIALGVAFGAFVAMTPTVGIQIVIVLVCSVVIRANRLAGLVMIYISNPVTMIPIYWVDYIVGARALRMEVVSRADFEQHFTLFTDKLDTDFWGSFGALWEGLLGLGWEITVPMFTGGVLLGLLVGLPCYPLTLRGVRAHQRRKAHRQALQALRNLRRLEREELDQPDAREADEAESVQEIPEARG